MKAITVRELQVQLRVRVIPATLAATDAPRRGGDQLDEILVGEGWVNTARRGQAPTLARVWGKHCALLYRDGMADTRGGRTTFGFTAQWGERIAGSIPDKDIGLRGGERVRVGESVAELITAGDLGYFLQDAVA